MQYRLLMASLLLLAPELAYGQTDRPYEGAPGAADPVRRWLSGDLHLSAGALVSYQAAPGRHILLGRDGVSLAVAGRQFTSEQAVLWITVDETTTHGGLGPRYHVRAYLSGRVAGGEADGRKGNLTQTVLKRGGAVVVEADIDGDIFVTAEQREVADPRGLPAYREASTALAEAGLSLLPELEPTPARPSEAGVAEPNEPEVGYTVSFTPLTDAGLKVDRTVSQGEEVITVIGRAYISWQESGEDTSRPRLFELQADSIVVWRRLGDEARPEADVSGGQEQGVTAVYVTGDVLFQQGQRTIRADELYYDLQHSRALARNVVMRSFDTTRNVPIYVRAGELRQVAQNEFEARDVVLTTSEFWTPQLSLEAGRVHIIDETQEPGPAGGTPEGKYDVELENVRFKYGNASLLKLPRVHSAGERPDVPVRSIRMGHDRTYGTSIETRWYLSRVLGLREPEGTSSELSLDYYGERGLGGGAIINYARENYYGSLLGYAIDDNGEDRLGRTRKNIDVPGETRGRFRLQHRHFLPYNWQVTAEASYLSDRNFLEQYYRGEFNVGKEQETLLHLKRIEDNWGLAFLGKTRINDFMDQIEELPSAEYHLTGQSLFDNRFTFFSDSQISRYRYRFSPTSTVSEPDEFFTFTGTRNELDLPLALGVSKVVPFVAGTFGYEDGAGFTAELDDTSLGREDTIWIGEAGVRMATQPFWCVYPSVESRLLDLHKLRHVIQPTLTAVAYAASDSVAEQRDTLDLGLSQRWQTKRGPADRRRTVDWLELDLDFVWVNDSSDETAGPDRFIWNTPFIPLANRASRVIPPLDRRTTDMFGPRQNYASATTTLRLTDTTAVLGDLYFDMQAGVVEQFDIGVSRLVWPNLSYYVGSRYLRNVENGLGQTGSNALTFAATYVLDPRYTLVLAEQYDSDYGANIRTDLTVIRKYHRMNLALTFSVDESVEEQRIVFSLWPEGVPELAIGLRRYMDLGGSDVYY